MTQDFDLRRAPYHAYGQSRFTTRTMTAFAFIQDGLSSIHGFWAVGRQFGQDKCEELLMAPTFWRKIA